ncbi:MAG: O-antigen ligase family protein [Pirellulaceae bacterium]
MTKHRYVTIVIALCMALSIVGAEWTWGYSGGGLFWLRGASRIGPSLCLFLVGIATGVFRGNISGARSCFGLLGGIMVVCSLLFQMMGVSGEEKLLAFDYSALSMIQAVLFAFMGYWIAQDDGEVVWLLRHCAMACALGSLWGGCVRFAGVEDSPFIIPQWPTRLLFLFGHCWYLNQWLTSQKKRLGSLLGLVACSLEVWISFHKPIVFSALCASVFLVTYAIMTTQRPISVVRRMAVLAILGVVALVVVNRNMSGRLLMSAEEIVYEKFLHQRVGSGVDWSASDELLESASGGRLDIWADALKRIGNHPLFGVGFGQDFGDNVHVHNWYLDLLLGLGIVGSFPLFAALLWWLRLVTKRKVIQRAGYLVVPCLAYIVGLMAYNMGGSIRVFFSMTSVAVLIMAIVTRLADRAMASPLGRYPNVTSFAVLPICRKTFTK